MFNIPKEPFDLLSWILPKMAIGMLIFVSIIFTMMILMFVKTVVASIPDAFGEIGCEWTGGDWSYRDQCERYGDVSR